MKKNTIIFIILILLTSTGLLFAGKINFGWTTKAIEEGKIDVGTVPDMDYGNRYHNIHTEVLGLDCTSCHINKYADDYLYQRKYKLPVRDMPGPVDRGACLSCHREGGVAKTILYGSAEE